MVPQASFARRLLGLNFEDLHFNIRDEKTGQPLQIAGWWIPHPEAHGRCVVLLHGLADAKVSAIGWAPLWHSLGFNILAIDLRAHGESGGTDFSAGYWERHDVDQVLDQLRGERPSESTHLVLFGVGVGAAVAAAAAVLRDDLAAVVLDSPPADFATAAMSHMDQLGGPGRLFQSLALFVARHLARCDYSAVRSVDLIKQISCPLMIIAPENGSAVNRLALTNLEQSLRSREREGEDVYWQVNSANALAIQAEPQEYEQRLRDFLN